MPILREVYFSPDVEEKIWRMHGLTQWDVEQVIYDPESEARWDVDPKHGGRVIVRGYTRTAEPRLVFVALRPIDPEQGSWSCVTAFSPTGDTYGSDDHGEG